MSPLRFGGGEVFMINVFRAKSAASFNSSTIFFSSSAEFLKELDTVRDLVRTSQFLRFDMGMGRRSAYIKLLGHIAMHPVRLVQTVRKSDNE